MSKWWWIATLVGILQDQVSLLLAGIPWDKSIKADPKTGDIKPYGADHLAEQISAILDDSIPINSNAPVTINTPANGATGLTINTPLGSNAITMSGGDFTITNGGALKVPAGGAITIDGNGLTVNGSMNLNKGFYLWNGVPLGLGTGGTTVFLGQVVSGSGDTYVLNIFGNGKGQPPTASNVTAKVPEIDSAEQIPAGTWVSSVFQFAGKDDSGQPIKIYQFQPPVWVS